MFRKLSLSLFPLALSVAFLTSRTQPARVITRTGDNTPSHISRRDRLKN